MSGKRQLERRSCRWEDTRTIKVGNFKEDIKETEMDPVVGFRVGGVGTSDENDYSIRVII
jgi:hypothetical protein